MKKVLIVSPFFFPELISTGKYNTDLAIQLSKQGLKVDILCSHPLYPDWKPKRSDGLLEEIKIKRGGGWLRYPRHPVLRRMVLEIWFFTFTLINIRKLRASDAIVVILPPSCFVLTTFLVNSKVKIIGIVHDLQAVHLKTGGGILKGLMLKAINIVETVAFRKCDSLIYLSEEMRQEANSEYGLGTVESHVAYPFISVDDFTGQGELSNLFNDEFFDIVYSGALGEKQNPQGIYEIACSLVDFIPAVRFMIFSGGPDYEKLKSQNRRDRVLFNDLVDTDSLGELLRRSDIQLVPQAMETSKGSLPSKIPNILASGSMIFAITDKNSELQNLLSQQKGCYISNTWDTQYNVGILSSLVEIPSIKYDRKDHLGLYQKDFLAKLISKMI
jgi:colanic acid biosynthesis glycosyl transferase WcaI